jgi:hypothetical protein
MAINFALLVYTPCYEVFARPVTFTPVNSQPGQSAYASRGIFDTNEVEVVGLDGSIYQDTRTELYILQSDFTVQPLQGDLVDIPFDSGVAGGSFEIDNVHWAGNAGGEVTLILKRAVTAS